MKFHFTHSALRLGDNLAHLHFLRKMAAANPNCRFVHFAHERYLPQLEAMVYDQPRIALLPLLRPRHFPATLKDSWWLRRPGEEWESVDAWKNAEGFFDQRRELARQSYGRFMLAWFHELATRMGFAASPLRTFHDLLFDYPALEQKHPFGLDPRTALVINSPAQSGQAPAGTEERMEGLIAYLARERPVICTHPTKVPRVSCTHDHSLTVTQIGRISNVVPIIVAISTGPSWPTFNIWNRSTVKLRLIICSENVDLEPGTIMCGTAEEALAELKSERSIRLREII